MYISRPALCALVGGFTNVQRYFAIFVPASFCTVKLLKCAPPMIVLVVNNLAKVSRIRNATLCTCSHNGGAELLGE